MTSLDRSHFLLSSEYLNFHFRLIFNERQSLSLATCFRAIKCNLALGAYFISVVTEFQNKFLEFHFGFHAFGPHSVFFLNTLWTKRCTTVTSPLASVAPLPSNWSGVVAAQGTLYGCSHWLCHKCRRPLLITTIPTWVTFTIAPSP